MMRTTYDRTFLPRPSAERLRRSTQPKSPDSHVGLDREIFRIKDEKREERTVLYLAYGSNLSVETFRGKRGIKPLTQVNVYVPELRLTFDLAGLPYIEPCFAGSQYRTTAPNAEEKDVHDEQYRDDVGHDVDVEKAALIPSREPGLRNEDYHKDRWRKPLIGVVYEVTLADYAHIIATEGGGSGYKDVVVSCHPFPDTYSPSDPSPDVPDTPPFKAHTLLSPWNPDQMGHDPRMRPDPAYAQPSQRYLNLITSGAEELVLPMDYRAYLASIRPYKITTWQQRVGQRIFLSFWGPIIMIIVLLSSLLADKDGHSPAWLARTGSLASMAMWRNYDSSFRRVFGDGERTIGDV